MAKNAKTALIAILFKALTSLALASLLVYSFIVKLFRYLNGTKISHCQSGYLHVVHVEQVQLYGRMYNNIESLTNNHTYSFLKALCCSCMHVVGNIQVCQQS